MICSGIRKKPSAWWWLCGYCEGLSQRMQGRVLEEVAIGEVDGTLRQLAR